MVKIRFGKKKPRAEEPLAETGCTTMCDQTDAPQSLREKLLERKFRLTDQLRDIDGALEILNVVPAAEDFARIVRREQILF